MSQQWGPPPGYQGPPQGYGPPPQQQGYGPPPQQGYGYGPPPPPQTVVYVQQNAMPAPVVVMKAPFNHGLHLVITICTCGVWLPVWIILAIAH